MKEYETVYIAKPHLTEAQTQQLNERIQGLIEKKEGRFFYARNMGKRRLAYPIAKQIKGIYYCVDYAAGGDVVTDVERMFRLNEDVIRYLTVVKAETVDVEARAAEIAARGEDAPVVMAEEAEEKKAEEPKAEEKKAEEATIEETVEGVEEAKEEAKEEVTTDKDKE